MKVREKISRNTKFIFENEKGVVTYRIITSGGNIIDLCFDTPERLEHFWKVARAAYNMQLFGTTRPQTIQKVSLENVVIETVTTEEIKNDNE